MPTVPQRNESAGPRSDAAPADAVLEALDEIVRVGRENIVAWVSVMERVERIRDLRRAGSSYSSMQIDSATPPIIDTVSRNQERLTVAAAQLRRALAHALIGEGWSQADIAQVFGVTRQRVGNLLRHGDTS